MGLGKTRQICAFLAGLFQSSLIDRVLIVVPTSLIHIWTEEFKKVSIDKEIVDFSGCSERRNASLIGILNRGGIVIVSYDLVSKCQEAIPRKKKNEMWDYLILDEGHLIKNACTKRATSVNQIPCHYRVILTGTPIQNNLTEFWKLMDFCCPDLLGDKETFLNDFHNDIVRINANNAFESSEFSKQLKKKIKPYFLRRLKSEVFRKAKFPRKDEVVVWLKLSTWQILNKICQHHSLLTQKDIDEIGGIELDDELKALAQSSGLGSCESFEDGIKKLNYTDSCKITFIISLLNELRKEEHSTLIFSHSKKMLSEIEKAIPAAYKVLRMDGDTTKSKRKKIIKDFQEGTGPTVFLITSQVGGVGLTLTKADRVIIVDPDWNPSVDKQCVDRVYRIGQKRHVMVYRLITCSTIEERIYEQQLTKGSLVKIITGDAGPVRLFDKLDKQKLLQLPQPDMFDTSDVQKKIEKEQHNTTLDPYMKQEIDFMKTLDIGGFSHHNF